MIDRLSGSRKNRRISQLGNGDVLVSFKLVNSYHQVPLIYEIIVNVNRQSNYYQRTSNRMQVHRIGGDDKRKNRTDLYVE